MEVNYFQILLIYLEKRFIFSMFKKVAARKLKPEYNWHRRLKGWYVTGL